MQDLSMTHATACGSAKLDRTSGRAEGVRSEVNNVIVVEWVDLVGEALRWKSGEPTASEACMC